MSIDTHLDATPSEIMDSATAIGDIEANVDCAEDSLISARNHANELEGETASGASGSISSAIRNCEDLVSDLSGYKNALTDFATAMGKVKTDLEGIRSRAAAGGLTVSGESIKKPTSSFPGGPDSSNSAEVRAFDEEQRKIALYKTLDTDTSHIRDRETQARQAFADACARITGGHPVTQAVAGTIGGYFIPDTSKGGWHAAGRTGVWAFNRARNLVNLAEAGGLRAGGAHVTRTVGGEKVVAYYARGGGTREWRHALNDAKLSNWSVLRGAKGSKAAKVADVAGKVGSSDAMKYAGRASTAVTFGLDAYDQWEKDSHNPSIGTGEKVARAATSGAGSAAGGWAGAQVGATAGAFVGGPVGAVVGGIAGAVVGSVAGKWTAGKANEGIHDLWH